MPFGNAGNIYLLGAIGQGIGPVLLTPLLTRKLNPNDFGEVTFVTSTASILGILFSLGLAIVISRTYVLHKDSQNTINSWFSKIIYIYVAISIALIFIETFSIYISVIAISFTFACLQLILPMARAQDKPTSFAMISVINSLLPSIIILLNLELTIFDSNLLALQLGSIFTAIFSFLLVKKSVSNRKSIKKYSFYPSLKSSLLILPHLFAIIGIMNIDRLLFGLELDKSFSGFLQIIMLVGTAPILILGALNHAWLNQNLLQLKNNKNQGFKHINLIILRLFALTTIISLTLLSLLKYILELLNPNLIFNSEIRNTIILTLISSGIYIVYIANTHVLIWMNKFSYLSISTPLSLLVQVLVIQTTINWLGYLSAALGFGAALSTQVIFLTLVRRRLKIIQAISVNSTFISIVFYWIFATLFLVQI